MSSFIRASSLPSIPGLLLTALASSILGANAQNVASAAAPAASSASAGGADAVPVIDQVVVIGSRSGDNTVFKSTAPIVLIDSKAIQSSGAANLSQALQTLVPSFHFPTSTPSSNAASFVKGISLRGLSTDETLVLINGKRRHATAQLNAAAGVVGKGAQTVDLDSIPLSSIDRIEVLLDGASAQYGSDAIAGAINIILKSNTEGGAVSGQFGKNAKGDGASRDVEGFKGFTLPQDGFLTLSFDAWKTEKTQVSTTDTRTMYFANDPREATYPNRNWFYGSGASERFNLVANAESGISDTTRIYGFTTWGWRKDHGFGNLRQPSVDQNVRSIYPDGFQPFLDVVSRDLSATAGVKWGEAADLGNFDLSATYGRNRVSSYVTNTLNASLGADSPTGFNTGDLLNQQTSANLDWVRPVAVSWLVKPLNVSAGLTYRHEGYTVFEGDYGSWANGGVPILDGPDVGKVATPGSQGFGGFSPSDAGSSVRNVYGGYLDLEADPTTKLKLELALRSEHYSDFGATQNGRLAARYEFDPALAWRASASTGYRAPSLGQIDYSRTIPNTVNGVITTTRVSRADSALAQALGATSLTPEKSHNLSTGIVLRPVSNASLSVDLYQIEIRNRIVLSDTLTGSAVTAALTAAGFPTYTGLAFFTNGADTRTRGVDVSGSYKLDLQQRGQLDLGVSFNDGKTQILSVKATPDALAAAGIVLIGRQSRGSITDAYPESTLRLSVGHHIGALDTNFALVRYGDYKSLQSSATLDQTFGPQWVADLNVAYRASRHWKLSLGANNLFDSHPDQVLKANRNPVVSKYSALSPEGGAGAYVYTRADYEF